MANHSCYDRQLERAMEHQEEGMARRHSSESATLPFGAEIPFGRAHARPELLCGGAERDHYSGPTSPT
jgi:hypothetical protein